MIILYTNVVSEPLKPKPDETVLEWLDVQVPETLYLTSITVAELLAGIESMPTGRRKTQLSLAAMAVANSFQVATRNVKDFTGSGVQILNPWDGKS